MPNIRRQRDENVQRQASVQPTPIALSEEVIREFARRFGYNEESFVRASSEGRVGSPSPFLHFSEDSSEMYIIGADGVQEVEPVEGESEPITRVDAMRGWYSPSPSYSFNDDDDTVTESMSEPDFYDGEDIYDVGDDEEYNPYPVADDMPEIELEHWDYEEKDRVADLFYRTVEHRVNWIFHRTEREGFGRNGRYGVTLFSLDDLMTKLERKGGHPLDTLESKFYDWQLGSTDFIMRMENIVVNNHHCVRLHFIYKPLNKTLCVQDRVWNGQKFSEINMQWAG